MSYKRTTIDLYLLKAGSQHTCGRLKAAALKKRLVLEKKKINVWKLNCFNANTLSFIKKFCTFNFCFTLNTEFIHNVYFRFKIYIFGYNHIFQQQFLSSLLIFLSSLISSWCRSDPIVPDRIYDQNKTFISESDFYASVELPSRGKKKQSYVMLLHETFTVSKNI